MKTKIDKNHYRNLWLQCLEVINNIDKIIQDYKNPNRPTEEECKKPIHKI